MNELPADAPYRKTVRRSLFHALREMWLRARGAELQRNKEVPTA